MMARPPRQRWAMWRIGVGLTLCLLSAAVWAEPDSAVRHLGLSANPVELPSLWRVVLGFVVCAGLIVAATWALRRYAGRLPWGTTDPSGVRVKARSTPVAGLRVTIIEVDARRFLIAENRNALQVVPLDHSVAPAPPPAGIP